MPHTGQLGAALPCVLGLGLIAAKVVLPAWAACCCKAVLPKHARAVQAAGMGMERASKRPAGSLPLVLACGMLACGLALVSVGSALVRTGV